MANEVTFKIKIDDNGGFKKVTMDAEELGKAVRSVQDEAEKAKRNILTWAEASQAIDILQGTIGELQGVVTDLTKAYQVQLVAETQIETIMRQRMGATDDMIQSVKDLCSAQQELGVIGDEVQLSGAQQMATFLKDKQSLDVLIPAMNNLVAQQNGLNATNQDAVSIGNMMGKAMQGQVEVLQRVGITFDETQKQVLQYGTESERAAMLAKVITENVGNMNAELAKTDAGKQKQLENTLGDVKEQLGQLVQGFAPAITMVSQLTIAGTGLAKLTTSLYTSVKAVYTLTSSLNIMSNAKTAGIAISRVLAASYRGEAVGATTAAVATRALSVAVKSLLVATGVGIAIMALGEAISYLTSSSDDATSSIDNLSEAEQRAKAAHEQTAQQIASVRSEMDLNIAKLKDFKGSKEQEKTLVQQMNTKYGEALGYYSSVSQWYEALTANSETYCNQMINEIRLRDLANRAADLDQKQHDIKYNADGTLKKYSTKNKTVTKTTGQVDAGDGKVIPIKQEVEVKGTSQLAEANKQMTSLYQQSQNVRKQMQQIVASGNKLTVKKVKGWSATPPPTGGGGKTTGKNTPGTTTTADQKDDPLQGSIDWYNKRISELNKELAATAESSTRKNLQTTIEGLQRELGMLKVEAGIDIMPKIEVKKDKNIFQKIDEQMAGWVKSHQQIEIEVKVKGEAFKKSMESIKNGWGSIQGVGNGIQGITDALQNNKNAWQAISGVINGFISIAEGIEGIVTLVNTLTASTAAHTTATTTDAAATAADTAASTTNTVAKSGEAIANATASGAKMPFPANLVAIAAGVAAVVAALAMVSGAFAEGGIVGGNSISGDKLLARVNSGEMILNAAQQARLFALANGAAVNVQPGIALPQVSVQSSKLQGLLAGDNSPRQIDLRMKVRGRDLVVAAANETRSNRRRSNIKI